MGKNGRCDYIRGVRNCQFNVDVLSGIFVSQVKLTQYSSYNSVGLSPPMAAIVNGKMIKIVETVDCTRNLCRPCETKIKVEYPQHLSGNTVTKGITGNFTT